MTAVTEAPPVAPAIDRAAVARIDALFEKADHPDTPGAALGVAFDGEVILERYYGCADLEHRVPVSADTLFDIASTSKQFTAAAILLLHRRGALSLDDEVQAYLPE